MLDRLRRRAEKEPERSSLQDVCSARASSVRLGDLQPRELVEVVGEVTHVCCISRDGSSAFEIELSDGSGTLVVLWTGRKHIAGIERGRRLAVWGRAAPMRRDDSLVLHNPRYELLA